MDIVNLKQCPELLQRLAQWHQHEWAHLNPGQSLADRIEKMQAYLNDDFIPSTFVALRQGVPLGSAAIIACDMEDRAELSPWLASVYVDEDNRRQGVGSALVQFAMKQAAEHGYQTLYLYTEHNPDFYQQLGWQIIETRVYLGCDVTIMSVALNK